MTRADDIVQIVVAAHALTRIVALRTRNDVPSAQWRALSALREHGPLRLGLLARAARTTQPGMTRLAARMVEDGLIARRDDPADSRATVLHATPQGLAALDDWRAELGAILGPLFTDLDDADARSIARAADILTSHTTLEGDAL